MQNKSRRDCELILDMVRIMDTMGVPLENKRRPSMGYMLWVMFNGVEGPYAE